ncbi:MAG TPA: TonB-dependent receptor [Polyangia bacterium]|nr:TonB-dependent receptor [Polyangia bacterium]
MAFALVLCVAAVARAQELEPPKLVERVEAQYPLEAAARGLTGVVTLELIVDAAGHVAEATVLAPAGHGFDEAALQAVRQFRFAPGRIDGKPVPVKVTYRYAFTMRAPPAKAAEASATTPPAPVRLRGKIVERGTRRPVEEAAVIALDESGATVGQTETDADGTFALRLAKAGTITVIIAAVDHKTLRVKETIADKEALSVRYTISLTSYALYESTVRAAPVREEVARVSLGGDEVRRIPGTRGDALAAVLNLPSVARSPFDLGQLVIRGSAPGESGAFLMGMQIPNAFHFGGLTSTFNSYLLDRFDLIPSNFSVRYGRLTGGIVDIVPREGRRDRIHVDAKADLYDAHVILEGPVGKGSFALSARRSYVDAFLGLFLTGGSFTVAPRYYDYQAELDYPVAGGKLKLLVFGSDDELAFVSETPPDADPTLAGEFSTRQWFHTLFASYKKSIGRWDTEATVAVGPQHFDGAVGEAARFNLDLVEMDARFEARQRLTPRFKLTYGLDVVTDYFWVSVDAPPQTTEEVPLGPLGERQQLSLRNQGFEASPALYVQGDLWAIPDRLLITPGVRADYLTGYEGIYVQPRLMTRFRVQGDWWLKGGAGLFHMYQQAAYHDAVLGNPKLRAEQAWHFTVGLEGRPLPFYRALTLEVNLFYKDLRNIAVTSADSTQRDGKVVPERYSDEGIGRVYGGDLLLKMDNGHRLYGWISYTLLKSERKDHPGEAWRPFEYDQTNILTLIVGYHLPWEIDVGARFRYVTGNPTTALGPGVFDADQGVVIPIPGMPYAERLPAFTQLDLRVDKRFLFKSWILSAYVDVSNVTNNANVEGYAYSYDYRVRTPVTGLPIIPSVGLRASF